LTSATAIASSPTAETQRFIEKMIENKSLSFFVLGLPFL